MGNGSKTKEVNMHGDIDLNKPIIVYYINVSGKGRASAERLIENMINLFKAPNLNQWFLPIQKEDSKIEILWKGREIETLQAKTNKRIERNFKRINELLPEGKLDEIKSVLRDIKLEDLLNDSITRYDKKSS